MLQSALVTGCSGFIGTELATSLVKKGWDVTGLVRSKEKARQMEEMGINTLIADITREDELKKISLEADAVFHLAASRTSEPDIVYQVNVEGTNNLVNTCMRENIKVFVYASSVAVYGDKKGQMVNESSPISPDLDYSWSKIKSEKILLNAYSENGFPTIILRLAWVYGPPTVEALKKGTVRLVNDGGFWFGFVNVEDAVQAFRIAAEKKSKGEIFIVSDNEPVMFKNFFCFIANTLMLPHPKNISMLKLKFLSAMPAIIRKMVSTSPVPSSDIMKILTYSTKFDNTKIKRKLGFHLMHPTYRQGILSLKRIAS